jgi:hypothetical protein
MFSNYLHLFSIGMNVLTWSICESGIFICFIIPATFSIIFSLLILGLVNLPFSKQKWQYSSFLLPSALLPKSPGFSIGIAQLWQNDPLGKFLFMSLSSFASILFVCVWKTHSSGNHSCSIHFHLRRAWNIVICNEKVNENNW